LNAINVASCDEKFCYPTEPAFLKDIQGNQRKVIGKIESTNNQKSKLEDYKTKNNYRTI